MEITKEQLDTIINEASDRGVDDIDWLSVDIDQADAHMLHAIFRATVRSAIRETLSSIEENNGVDIRVVENNKTGKR